jgi:hypothetical protein
MAGLTAHAAPDTLVAASIYRPGPLVKPHEKKDGLLLAPLSGALCQARLMAEVQRAFIASGAPVGRVCLAALGWWSPRRYRQRAKRRWFRPRAGPGTLYGKPAKPGSRPPPRRSPARKPPSGAMNPSPSKSGSKPVPREPTSDVAFSVPIGRGCHRIFRKYSGKLAMAGQTQWYLPSK